MVEIVSQIKSAETQAEDIRRNARGQAAKLSEEATDAGKRMLEAENQKAAAVAGQTIREAEEKAAAYLEVFAAQTREQCGILAETAKANRGKAAGFIAERIVQSL